ncbi:MAG: hypothetical protein L7G96_07490 [Vulcanisaeta sp.]|nr:hypothetical protein [Vulcanisaeta sp.]
MPVLANIKSKDTIYRRVMSILYAALPKYYKAMIKMNPQVLQLATELFFVFYSVYPRLVDEAEVEGLWVAVHSAFKELWPEMMVVRDKYGTMLHFPKSFALALHFLKAFLLMTQGSHIQGMNREALKDYIIRVMRTMVIPQASDITKEAEEEKEKSKRAVQAEGGDEVGKGEHVTWSLGYSFVPSRKALRELVHGIVEAFLTYEGQLGIKHPTAVLTGVTIGKELENVKPIELISWDVFTAKYASSSLNLREYGEKELKVVVAVDFSSSTTVDAVTSDLRLIAMGILGAVRELNGLVALVAFKDKPITVPLREAMKFIGTAAADGGTDITSALRLADEVAEPMGEDAKIVLVSDCKDIVRYNPRHKAVATVVLADPSQPDHWARDCVNFFKKGNAIVLIPKGEVFRNPEEVGERIGELLAD